MAVRFDRGWPKEFPDEAGMYVIYDKGEVSYFGETGNIRGRMKDLRRTLNHSFRRSLGYSLFNEIATSSEKFTQDIELKLDKYFEEYITVATMPLSFGRLEFEEYLVDEYGDRLLNKKVKRKK